jgi:hypothetical protein
MEQLKLLLLQIENLKKEKKSISKKIASRKKIIKEIIHFDMTDTIISETGVIVSKNPTSEK